MASLYLYTTNLQEAMDASKSVDDMLQSEDYPPIPLALSARTQAALCLPKLEEEDTSSSKDQNRQS